MSVWILTFERTYGMLREIPAIVVYIAFLVGFVYLMNYVSGPIFAASPDPNWYSVLVAGIIVFSVLMVYWERIFPAKE